MASLTIRNIPEGLLASLRERAKRERRSVNSEVLVQLERALSSSPSPMRHREAVRALAAHASTTPAFDLTADDIERDLDGMFAGDEGPSPSA